MNTEFGESSSGGSSRTSTSKLLRHCTRASCCSLAFSKSMQVPSIVGNVYIKNQSIGMCFFKHQIWEISNKDNFFCGRGLNGKIPTKKEPRYQKSAKSINTCGQSGGNANKILPPYLSQSKIFFLSQMQNKANLRFHWAID